MALGKRKTRDESGPGSEEPQREEDLRARFQKAFEAKFKPLDVPRKPKQQPKPESEDSDDSDGAMSDWSGLSDDPDGIEVVEHAVGTTDDGDVDAYDKKSFMSSKPPSSDKKPVSARVSATSQATQDDGDDATNLKHDLALQRLLKESHLLDPSTFSATAATTPEGRSRLKAADLRMQDLGAKESLSRQERMPMAMRKGIAAKAAQREDKRRKEAAENGVILEKARFAPKSEKRRVRGIGGPNIGRFQGGTLSLSSKDVREIEGSKRGSFGKRPKGRR